MTHSRYLILSSLLALGAQSLGAQTFYDRLNDLNVVTTAMPMLNIGPDARSGGMANTGIGLSPDANAIFGIPPSWPLLARVTSTADFPTLRGCEGWCPTWNLCLPM